MIDKQPPIELSRVEDQTLLGVVQLIASFKNHGGLNSPNIIIVVGTGFYVVNKRRLYNINEIS